MATYTVDKAEHKKTFTGKTGGEFDVWTVVLTDSKGIFTAAEMVLKQGSPAPAGQVEGELDTSGPYVAKFKRAFAPKPGGGGGKSPSERAEIRRLASHKVAVELLGHQIRIAEAKGEIEKFAGKTAQGLLSPLIDFLEEDAKRAGEMAA